MIEAYTVSARSVYESCVASLSCVHAVQCADAAIPRDGVIMGHGAVDLLEMLAYCLGGCDCLV